MVSAVELDDLPVRVHAFIFNSPDWRIECSILSGFVNFLKSLSGTTESCLFVDYHANVYKVMIGRPLAFRVSEPHSESWG